MPLRNFRNVEYYRIKNDNTWDTQTVLIPYEIPYENCIDYIWYQMSDLNLTDNIKTIAICNFPEIVTTTNSDGLV